MNANEFSKDQQDFEADIEYLRSLGASLLEHAGHAMPWPHDTVYDQLIADMSPAARRDVAAVREGEAA